MKYKFIKKKDKNDKLVERKVFLFGSDNNQINGAGILFYKKNKILLINNYDRNMYEDFGGKVDHSDNYVYETAAREAQEESNNIFLKKNIIPQLKNKQFIYVKHSKYAVYLLELKQDVNLNDFGKFENKCKINRQVEWININDIIKRNKNIVLIHRLRFNKIFEKIQNI